MSNREFDSRYALQILMLGNRPMAGQRSLKPLI
jgi:hypothetical protein